MSLAKFYDIAKEITPEYSDLGFVLGEHDEFENRIKTYLNNNKQIKFGDIIFVGTMNETRQYYGFRLVLNDGKTFYNECGYFLPMERYNIHKELIQKGIKYDDILKNFYPYHNFNNNHIISNENVFAYWYGMDYKDQVNYEEYENIFFEDILTTYREHELVSKELELV